MFRWGIISTGRIANDFARGVAQLPDAVVAAVGSRTQRAADAFGDEHGVERRYASYEALAADPELDAIYVATPHPFHAPNCIMCLEAGKAVLCEKPFTINAAELEKVVALAREKRLFLMEGMWSRFMPATVRLRELLASGVIGDINIVDIDFGFRAPFNPQHRLFAPELGRRRAAGHRHLLAVIRLDGARQASAHRQHGAFGRERRGRERGDHPWL